MWENCEAELSYCTDLLVTEKGFENSGMKEKCAEEDSYFEGTFKMEHLGSGLEVG